ncbi:MAG: hypothetical protein EXR58_07180 [Chloroflexi bacterium]|nr:hypothetical protein [Chloroflexota bacterium]
MQQPEGPFCQSCGMPLARDEKGGGSNVDGSTSTQYCSHCYEQGHFTLPDLTLAQMMEAVRGRLQGVQAHAEAIDGMVAGIVQLERWRDSSI